MPASCARRPFLTAAAALLAVPAASIPQERAFDVPYVPTPPAVVEAMLDMAAVKAGEQLIDLGSGDGRIVIAAARRGASALGVELDPDLVSQARSLAELAGQQDRARFIRADLFTVRLRDADVVTLYLLTEVNRRLRPKLLTELRPGTRVVSHAFEMGDWTPDDARSVAGSNIYFWTVPAVAGGVWRLTRADGTSAVLRITQRYSQIEGTLDGRAFTQGRLRGAALSFTADGIAYRGTVGERAIEGEAVASGTWRAERTE